MQMGDRFEGHIVQGHIDTIGTISKIENLGNSFNFYIKVEKNISHLIVPKGSITIDGVSLTVNDIQDEVFRLTIIPHTMENTIFKKYKVGTKVNIETDLFARYIYNILKNRKSETSWNEIDSIMARY
jgi:riboflavin synthase